MALPSYKALLDDPKFQSASVDEQKQLNDKYWSLYDKENPGDQWAKQMRTATYGLFGTKAELADAPPVKQRELDLQREAFNFSVNLGVADKENMWSSPEQRIEAVNAKQADFEKRKSEVDKTMSLFRDPKVDEAMQPAWQALTSSASMGEVFNAPDTWGDTALKGVSYVASAGGSSERRDKARADYEKYRSTMSQDFGLTTDEVDDLVKHRLDKQADPVSQDVAGTVHFRTDLLVRPTSEIEKAIADSKLPNSVKDTARKEAPGKIALFKNGVLDRVKKDYPELAADMSWTGKVDDDYAALTGKLNKDWPEQLGGGIAGAGLSGLFANVPSYAMAPQPGVVPVSSREQITNEIDRQRGMEAAAKKQQAVNELSSFIDADKTKIFNVDAATIGQGIYSVGESVLLGAMTGGAGTALVSADRIAKAGKVGKALLGFSKGALNTAPVAGIYGAQQGIQTYEQALASDDPKVRENAANLAVGSAAIEFGVTTVFGGIGLGGTEDYASKLASPALRKEAAVTIGKAWKNLAKNAGEAVVGEVPEEALITALDSVHIQQKLNPQMTDAEVRKAIYDTVVSTALTTAPLGGIKAAKEGLKDFSNVTTHDRSTDELKRESDDIYKAAAQEGLAEDQAAGGDVAPPSAERVAALGAERSQLTEQLKKAPPGGRVWLDAKERILEINDILGEEKPFTVADIPKVNEQDTTTPAGEANAPQALQLPEVPTESDTPTDTGAVGVDAQRTGIAEAQAQGAVIPAEPEELFDSRSYIAQRVSEGLTREEAFAELESKRDSYRGKDIPAGTRVLAPDAPGANTLSGRTSDGVWEKQTDGTWVLLDSNGDTTTVKHPNLAALAGGTFINNTPSAPAAVPTESLPADAPPSREGGVAAAFTKDQPVEITLESGETVQGKVASVFSGNRYGVVDAQGELMVKEASELSPITTTTPPNEEAFQKVTPDDFVATGVPEDEAAVYAAITNSLIGDIPTGLRVVGPQQKQDAAAGELSQEDTTPLPEAEVPSRQATKTEEAGGLSYAELEAHPTALRKIVNKLRMHKVFRVGPGNTKQTAKRIMDQMVSNILKIHDMVPKDIRDKSKLWYSGANKISHQWSKKFGVSTQAVAGVIAAMSPQKDWFQNVSLAERLLSIWTGQDRETDTFNESMRDAAKKMDASQAKAAKGKGYLLIEGEEVPLMAHEANLNRLMGKRFDDLEAEDKAFFVRLYDSTYNDPSYALVSPDGRFGKFHNNKDGKPTRIAWGSNTEVSKAIRILENPGVSNISEQLGKAHKIRSFYNNIVNPESDATVTSDTHAVAVAYLLPLSGSSLEVSHNFGGTGSGSFKGTYAFITEAYRRAAAERGIKPSQMQSITWEAIREIFTAATKRNESAVAKIRKLWEDYSRGKTDKSYEQTADEAIAAGGGYAFPAWYRQSELGFGDSGTSFDRDTTFTSKRGGAGADGLRTGAGRGNGRGSQPARPRPQGGAEQGTLFQADEPSEPFLRRGTYNYVRGMGDAYIQLLKHRNKSTFIHELFHFMREFILDEHNPEAVAAAARRGITVDMMRAVAKAWGARQLADGSYSYLNEDGSKIKLAEERGARGWERYIREGKFPEGASAEMKALLQKVSSWLKEIYTAVTGTAINVEVSPIAREIFDKLLVGPQAKAAPKARSLENAPAPSLETKKPSAPVDEISAKREYMDALRRKYGFPQYFSGDPVTDQMVTDEAVQALDAAKAGRPGKYKVGQDLVNELEGREKGPDAVELALLVHQAKVLDGKLTRAYAGLEGSSGERQSNDLSGKIAAMEEQLNAISTLISETGTAAGRMLQSFKKVWDNKFDLVRMTAAYLRDKRAATGDIKATVSPEERKQIREINTRLKERKKALDDAVAAKEKEIKAKEAESVVKAVARDVKGKTAPTKESVKKQLRASFDTGGALERLRAKGFGVTLEQGDVAPDKDYLDAVERGDMATAQRLVDEAAKAAGYVTEAYHGSKEEFDEFGEQNTAYGYFFAPDKRTAEYYGPARRFYLKTADMADFTDPADFSKVADEAIFSDRKIRDEEKVKDWIESAVRDTPNGRAFASKVLDLTDEQMAEYESFSDILDDLKKEWEQVVEIVEEDHPQALASLDRDAPAYNEEVENARRAHDELEQSWYMDYQGDFVTAARTLGYDSVFMQDPAGSTGGSPESYVVFDPNQIKSADPVTRDENGNVIPLSQRFNPASDSILYQQDLDPETLDDLATIGAGLILDRDLKNIDDFTASIVDALGPEAMDYSQEIYQRAQDKIEAARKSRKIPKSPEQLLKEVDPEKELSNRMVFNMVRGYLLQGMDPQSVLKQVHKDLTSVWEDISFEEVSDAFTGYGKVKYPSTEEINVQLRKLRNVERIKRQIDVVRAKQVPSKTGFQRDKPPPEERALQKELKAAMKEAGIKATKTNQLKSSLDAIKTRFRNELEDLQRALARHEALPPTKDREEYDKEAAGLRDQVRDMRQVYEAIFDSEYESEQARLVAANRLIDEKISKEYEMLANGILSGAKKERKVLDDPTTKARLALLDSLQSARHTAQRALRPRKSQEQIALDAAIRENKKGLARDEERVRTGDTSPKTTTPRFTPNEELKAILAERASLKQILKLQRQQKARLGKPARDATRQEQRAAEAIERSLDKIEKRIQELASGVVTPVRRILPFTTPGLSVARALRDSRRRVLAEMEKSLKQAKSAEQIREERMVKAAIAKKARYQEMLDKGIYTKEPKVSKAVAEWVAQAQFEAAAVEAEWNKSRAKMLWENRTMPSKVWSRFKTALRATGVLRLGGDLLMLRHAGTWVLGVAPLSPMRTAAAAKQLARSKATERGTYEVYQASLAALNVMGFSDKDVRLLNPMEPAGTAGRSREAEEITGADLLDMTAKLPKKYVVTLVPRALRSVEFINTSLANIARVETAAALRGDLNIPMSDATKRALAMTIEISSGRGYIKPDSAFEKAIPFLNDWVVISARYMLSRVQMAYGKPLWSSGISFGTRAKIFRVVYLQTLIGRAIIASAIAKLYPPDDDETYAEFAKRVLMAMGIGNVRDSNYGKLKLSHGFSIDIAQGVGPFVSVLARISTGRTMRDGELVDLEDGEKGRIASNYLTNRANMVSASLFRTFVTGRSYDGTPLPSVSRMYKTLEGTEEYPVDGPMLAETAKEWFAPIALADTKRIYEQFGVKGVVLWSAMMTGAGVQSYQPKPKKEKFY